LKRLITSILFLLSLATTVKAEPREFTCKFNEEGVRCLTVEEDTLTLKSGFLIDFDPKNRDGFFYVGLEMVDWKMGKEEFSLDFGIANSRLMLGLGWGAFYKGKVGPFVWAGYNIADNSPAYGVGLTVLKL